MKLTPTDPTESHALLCVEGLRKVFGTRSILGGQGVPDLTAVNEVSFAVARGETFGLVGESGCGKSTIARCIVRVTEPTNGRIVFDGVDVLQLKKRELQRIRRRMQIVFQDSSGALNPRMTVRSLVEEPLIIHGIGGETGRRRNASEILELVGIVSHWSKLKPYALSGGQRQRVGLARALVLRPDLLILDEPISSVDVSVQAQILNLLRDLQEDLRLTYIFIVHDLNIAEYFCDHIAVIYLGRIVEMASTDVLFRRPLHPYTVGLLAAVPLPDPTLGRQRERILLRGEAQSSRLVHQMVGCPFQPRCPVGRNRRLCRDVDPPLELREGGHWAACHFPGEMPVERFDVKRGLETSTTGQRELP